MTIGSGADAERVAREETPRIPVQSLDYQVPPVAGRLPYFLGGLSLAAFVLLAATGVVLTQFYSPGPLGAHASIQYTITQVPLGGWVRSVHSWSAWLMALTVTLHLAWIVWRGSYRRPREITYYTGLVALATMFLFYFSGTVLPNDQAGAEALAHAVVAAEMSAPLGAPLTPGFSAVPLLTRLYGLHVAVLPLVFVALIAAHLWLIRHLEISTWPGEGRSGEVFRAHAWRLVAYASWAAAVIGALAWQWPARLGYPAVGGAEVTKPPFFFLWIYALENWFGSAALVVGPALPAVVLLALPWIDRGASPRAADRRLVVLGNHDLAKVQRDEHGIFGINVTIPESVATGTYEIEASAGKYRAKATLRILPAEPGGADHDAMAAEGDETHEAMGHTEEQARDEPMPLQQRWGAFERTFAGGFSLLLVGVGTLCIIRSRRIVTSSR